MKTILRSDAVFYGWPANHGHWQWGDEFLFGVMAGKRDGAAAGMHKVSGPLSLLLVRSLDGGDSWKIDQPGIEGDPSGHFCVMDGAVRDRGMQDPPDDMSNRIIKICGFFDHGGEGCFPWGAYYTSADRGLSWTGPHTMLGDLLDLTWDGTRRATSRTCIIGDLAFLSHGSVASFGEDRVLVAKIEQGGFKGLGHLPSVRGRQVMPSVAQIGSDIFVACRRRVRHDCWIDIYQTDPHFDKCEIINPRAVNTGRWNGNPPALLAQGDILWLAYGDRDTGKMMTAFSADGGINWKSEVLRSGGAHDFGYPRLFLRSDGRIVCVYYWFGGIEMQVI